MALSERTRRSKPVEEFPHSFGGVASDLASERGRLGGEIAHDYSTTKHGVVPLDDRRPLWHFGSLWLTFCSGFAFLFVGTALYDGGNSLMTTLLITLVGCGIYFGYVMFAAYLGSRTGQTFTLLTRSVFGRGGSGLVSVFLFLGAVGWCGFQANLLAQIWDGLYGWGSVELLGIILAVAMIFNNLLGFSGITVFARYVCTPILVVWVLYLVIKGLTTDYNSLTITPKASSSGVVGFMPGVGLIIGYLAYGSEEDFWRYGKPKFSWPAGAFAFAFIFGMVLCAVGGWMMAALAKTSNFGTVVHFTTAYSLGGVAVLTFIIATVTQFATNDSNYYGAINAVQNIMGGWSKWRRVFSCIVTAVAAPVASWLVIYVIPNGFFKMAQFLAITAASATVIMVVDHYVVPRLFKISRPLRDVPTWKDAAWFNWPATIVLLISVAFGAYGSGIFPGESSSTYWFAPLPEAWAIAGIGYLAAVALVQAVSKDPNVILGFSRSAREAPGGPGEIIDIASEAEPARVDAPSAGAMFAAEGAR
ncbi:MAG: cytosine permease [Solirubrobacteraceae bacterium]